ncbi:MAG: carotenoid 1,2-hydratase [Pseudomonadota bacterium]
MTLPPPHAGASAADAAQKVAEPETPTGFRFDYTPPAGGYAWWYIDGVSEDGENAIVIIIFVGSVFSPYYAWSGWADPSDHCAINVALYGRPQRWSMTERRRGDTLRTADTYKTGNSRVTATESGLDIEVDELCAPLPQRMRGRVRVALPYSNSKRFQLDPNGRHFWSPVCPHASVSVDFEAPGLSWRGHGYVDTNYGLEPIYKGFDYWDWSRTPLFNGDTVIRYVTDPVSSRQRALHVAISPDGTVAEVDAGSDCDLKPTPVWRIRRRAGTLEGTPPHIVKTLEDTPFYSRSMLDYASGTSGLTTHETLSCRRLKSPLVRAMLPFRMPRLSL